MRAVKDIRRYGMPACHDTFSMCTDDRPELDEEGERTAGCASRVARGNGDGGADYSGPQWQVAPLGRGWRMEVTDELANRLYVIHFYAEKPK